MLVGEVALNVETVEKLITMTVVELPPDSDWKPADAAKLGDEGPTVGVGTGLVLLSGKNAIEVDEGLAGEAAELLGPEGPGEPEELDVDVDEELPICEASTPVPPEIAGCLPCWLDVDVLEALEGDLAEDVVECAVVDGASGFPAPNTNEPATGVEGDDVELVDVCVVVEVVLVAMTVEDVEGLDT